MKGRFCAAFLMWVAAAFAVGAQGFADLGTTAEGFAVPERGAILEFPRDHGVHEQFRIEWWYVTATLRGDDGRDYGVQWTLFRSALRPGAGEDWASSQLWMGHAGLTTPARHFVAERLARGGIGQAGVTARPFAAWIDEWRLEGAEFDHLNVSAQGTDFRYELQLSTDRPLVLHGDRGYSVKSPEGQASHYYSQPFYAARGTLSLPDGPVAVSGSAWLDREWSSQPLSASQSGWDWFSLVFSDDTRLMGFRLRSDTGAHFTAATWIDADGTATTYPDGAFRAEPLDWHTVAGREVPTSWQVRLADRGINLRIEALNPASWMGTSFPYWEGPVSVAGSHSGRGYLEMTGYE